MIAPRGETRLYGLLAEFGGPKELLDACEKVRDSGFRHWDAYAPFPIHGLNDAMGIRSTHLPWLVLGAGITGALSGILLQWWTNAFDYPFMISGKPFWSVPANIPVAFELTVLLAAATAFTGMLALNRLPRFTHPLSKVESFRRSTADKFFIAIESRDPKFDEARTRSFLESLGCVALERVEA